MKERERASKANVKLVGNAKGLILQGDGVNFDVKEGTCPHHQNIKGMEECGGKVYTLLGKTAKYSWVFQEVRRKEKVGEKKRIKR